MFATQGSCAKCMAVLRCCMPVEVGGHTKNIIPLIALWSNQSGDCFVVDGLMVFGLKLRAALITSWLGTERGTIKA